MGKYKLCMDTNDNFFYVDIFILANGATFPKEIFPWDLYMMGKNDVQKIFDDSCIILASKIDVYSTNLR